MESHVPISAVELFLQEIITSIWRMSEESFEDCSDRLAFLGSDLGSRLAFPRSQIQPQLEKLDSVKFICKDVWPSLFGKPCDKLQSNGVNMFVIEDASLLPLRKLAECCLVDSNAILSEEAEDRKALTCILVTAVIEGALLRLGFPVKCQYDPSTRPPAARFILHT